MVPSNKLIGMAFADRCSTYMAAATQFWLAMLLNGRETTLVHVFLGRMRNRVHVSGENENKREGEGGGSDEF